MVECFNCGVSVQNARLFDAIHNEGIMKVCDKCAREEHIPVIRRPTTFQLKEAEEKKSFYERASGSSKMPVRSSPSEEVSLREIVDRNYESRVPKNSKPRPEMVTNFHWIIMRGRRMKKLTQAQLGKEIQESEAAIRMAEQGILPEDDYRLVNKLEGFLGIRIVRDEFADKVRPQKKAVSFDLQEMKELTIEDLKEMKAQREKSKLKNSEDDFEVYDKEFEEDKEFDDSQGEREEELSREEMDRIIFGR